VFGDGQDRRDFQHPSVINGGVRTKVSGKPRQFLSLGLRDQPPNTTRLGQRHSR
jgi:hypothetical protein